MMPLSLMIASVSVQLEGIGATQCWAFTPAVDLLDSASLADAVGESEAVNVLIAGAGDVCHALKSLCQASQHSIAHKHIHVSTHSPATHNSYAPLLPLLQPSRLLTDLVSSTSPVTLSAAVHRRGSGNQPGSAAASARRVHRRIAVSARAHGGLPRTCTTIASYSSAHRPSLQQPADASLSDCSSTSRPPSPTACRSLSILRCSSTRSWTPYSPTSPSLPPPPLLCPQSVPPPPSLKPVATSTSVCCVTPVFATTTVSGTTIVSTCSTGTITSVSSLSRQCCISSTTADGGRQGRCTRSESAGTMSPTAASPATEPPACEAEAQWRCAATGPTSSSAPPSPGAWTLTTTPASTSGSISNSTPPSTSQRTTSRD